MKKGMYPHRPGTRLIPTREYLSMFGISRTEYFRRVGIDEAPPPITLGNKSNALPDYAADDYVRHLMESDKKFNSAAYLEKIGGCFANP
jgi:predicted DNA-binding transcriptional regulator AlpA